MVGDVSEGGEVSQGSSRHHREGTTRFGSRDFTESNISNVIDSNPSEVLNFRVCDSQRGYRKRNDS